MQEYVLMESRLIYPEESNRKAKYKNGYVSNRCGGH
jgi:hypothetical protein